MRTLGRKGRKRREVGNRLFHLPFCLCSYVHVSVCRCAELFVYFSPMCLTMLTMVGWKSSFMASCVRRSIPWEDHFTMFILTHTNARARERLLLQIHTVKSLHQTGHAHTHLSQTHSLAPPQGGLHTLPPVPLVVVDEREGQGDVEGVGPARCRGPFPRLKCNGEVDPGCRPPGFEALDEVLAKDLAQHGFEGQVHADGTVRSAWERGTADVETARNWRFSMWCEVLYLKPCRAL